jgi:integrase
LFKHVPERFRAMVVLMCLCGLRWGEAAALRHRHLDRVNRELSIDETVSDINGHLLAETPKSAAGTRRVPLPDPAYEALLAHLAHSMGGQEDYLFRTSAGAPVCYRNFRRDCWNPAIAAAGLPVELTPHCRAPLVRDVAAGVRRGDSRRAAAARSRVDRHDADLHA